MNRRDFAHLLAISGVASFGWSEKVLNSALPSAVAHSPDSMTSRSVPPLKPGRRSRALQRFCCRSRFATKLIGAASAAYWTAHGSPD
jgi:hypothetical protein